MDTRTHKHKQISENINGNIKAHYIDTYVYAQKETSCHGADGINFYTKHTQIKQFHSMQKAFIESFLSNAK